MFQTKYSFHTNYFHWMFFLNHDRRKLAPNLASVVFNNKEEILHLMISVCLRWGCFLIGRILMKRPLSFQRRLVGSGSSARLKIWESGSPISSRILRRWCKQLTFSYMTVKEMLFLNFATCRLSHWCKSEFRFLNSDETVCCRWGKLFAAADLLIILDRKGHA